MGSATGRSALCPGCGRRRGITTKGLIRWHCRNGSPCDGAGAPATPSLPHRTTKIQRDHPEALAARRHMAHELAARLGSATITTGGTITVHTPGAVVAGRTLR